MRSRSTHSSSPTPREGRRDSTSFTLSRRSNGKIHGTRTIFRYFALPPQPAYISERDQERVSALAQASPAESDPNSVSPVPPKSTPKSYTIINQPPVAARRPSNAPPKIISHKELANRNQGVQCFDAVPVNEPEDAKAGLEKFIPMLEEYLKRTLKTVSRSAHTINIHRFFPSYISLVSNIQPTTPGASSTNDYVWDIFYHRTSKSADWNKISQNIGTLYVLHHESHDIASLPTTSESTGLPASFGDPDESDPESEVEDEGDEDSNG